MTNIIWSSPTGEAFILKNTVQIWKINYFDFSGEENIFLQVLQREELARADKFHYKIDRKRYIVTRAFLRIILSRIIKKDPSNIHFSFTKYGKPYLKKINDIYFNISHSTNIGLIAISDIATIGVDVEQYRKRMHSADVARRFFSENEVQTFLNLPKSQKLAGFFNCWTRKEAFIKALGLGLSMPLKDFDVTLKPDEPAKLLDVRYQDERADYWTIENIPIENNYAAAFAIKAKNFKELYWSVKDLL